MNWITIVWSMASAVCATLALIHLTIWFHRRSQVVHLLFALTAFGAAGNVLAELGMLKATTVEGYATALRVSFVPLVLLAISMPWYVRSYFGTGRRSLAAAVTVVWALVLIIDAFSPFSPVFSDISGLRITSTPWGEPFALAKGVIHPLNLVISVADLVFLVFVVDASATFWRRGERRRAMLFGIGIVGASLVAVLVAQMIDFGVLQMPYVTTFIYIGVIVVFGYPLTLDVVRTAQLARQLQESEAELRETHQRMDLTTSAAELGIWVWDIVCDEIWISEKGQALFGFAPSEKLDIDRFRNAIHPDDRDSLRQAVQNSLDTGMEYEAEHRVILPTGEVRWLDERGCVEFSGEGTPARMRGVSRDVTRRKLAEEALLESEARFRTMANTAPVLIWMSGLDKLCTFFNRPWLEFTGRSLEQEMGNGWSEGVHPDDLPSCLKVYTEAFDARQPFVMQYRLRRHDGEYRWISDSGVPRYDAQKGFAGYIGSCMDVTELVTKEQALRESEERMSLAAHAAGLILWTRDVQRDEISLSDKDRAFFGFSPREKLNGDRIRSVVHPEDREFVRHLVENSMRTRDELAAEYRVMLPDGKVRWVTRRGRVEFDDNGEPIWERGVLMDITERKQAEEKFRLATEASPSGIILVNDRGHIVLVNSQIEKLFGYQREELVGKLVDILVPERFASQHPAHRAEFVAAPTARAMGAGRELFARRKDGSEFPVEIGLSPIEAPEGILVLATVVDISARKIAEAEALQRRQEVGHLSRVAVMGELAASIAHELNQPLSGIISNASAGQRFIDRGNVDLGELRDLLTDIVADGRRAGEVIRGVRSMVKKGPPVRQRVNLNDLVMNVVQMVKPDAVLHSCEMETLLYPNLPAIEADPIQLQQALINLVINAFDAMRNTPLSRRKVVIATEGNGENTICASVRDYGVGISEEARDRLFEHFFTTKAQGLGMGLGIVRSIVESHAGTVTAENVAGGGARFHFTLPVNAAPL